jgi:hypothetical protein
MIGLVRRSFASGYRAGAQEEKVRAWVQRLQGLANTAESKGSTGQLASLIGYYTRPAPAEAPAINWEEWEAKITTPGLVKKVRGKFQELEQQEYDVEGIANKVNATESRALEEIRNELNYHTALWLANYGRYLESLLSLEEYSNNITYLEAWDFNPYNEANAQELMETHNYIPGSKDDINLRDYIMAQFAWGKKVVSFYRHPADEFKCFKATKSVLGR